MRVNGEALKVIRERSGLTVTGAARLAGVSQPTWSNLESGARNATPGTVIAMAEVLKVPLVAIIAEPEPEPEPEPENGDPK